MPEIYERGNHPYVDAINDVDQIHETACLAKSVYDSEKAAIDRRRKFIRERIGRDRRKSAWTGLAFSGGGIRSASFGLGVLQALQAKHKDHPKVYGIEGIDYLSTVSGGGYIGCSLTATLQKTRGKFPFTNPDNYDDTDSVRHIRDFSNYLIPHGALDVATALGIIGRGLVANTVFILPVLLFCVWITLLIHPTVESLGTPIPVIQDLIKTFPGLPLLPLLHGYWFTAILAALNFLFLFAWALAASMNIGKSATLRGGWVFASKILFLATLVIAFFETQPFILWVINPAAEASALHKSLNELWSNITSSTYLASAGTFFGFMATVFAFLSKYLGDIVAVAKRATGWTAWAKKISAMATD